MGDAFSVALVLSWFQVQNVHLQLAIGVFELLNAVERISKSTKAVADPVGGPGGSGSPIRPDTCLRLKSLQRQYCISLFSWLTFLMKRVLYFATKLNSRDIQECDFLWVPSYDLFASACKAVFPAPTATGFHRLRTSSCLCPLSDQWEGVWGKSNLPQKSSTVLSEPKFGPPPTPPMKNSWISPCKDVSLSSEPIKAYAGACK